MAFKGKSGWQRRRVPCPVSRSAPRGSWGRSLESVHCCVVHPGILGWAGGGARALVRGGGLHPSCPWMVGPLPT